MMYHCNHPGIRFAPIDSLGHMCAESEEEEYEECDCGSDVGTETPVRPWGGEIYVPIVFDVSKQTTKP